MTSNTFCCLLKYVKSIALFCLLQQSLCILFYPVNSYLIQLQCTENSGLLKTYESTEDFSFKIFADNTWLVADSKARLVFMALFFLISHFFFYFVLYFEIVKETNQLRQSSQPGRKLSKTCGCLMGLFLILQLIP